MYEGTPDTPHQGRWWEIIEKYKVTILYCAPTAIRTFMKWGEEIPAKFDLSIAAAARVGRRADQPRGLDLVPRDHRRRPHARSSTPGGRPRPASIMISPLPGRHRRQAGRGDDAAARHRGRRRRRRRQAGAQRRRRLPGAHRAVAVDAARPSGATTSGTRRPTGRGSRAATSPATAPRRTTTATSGCSAGSTT